jgi:hypothetical protein
MYRIWTELGAFSKRPSIAYDEFVQAEDDNNHLTVSADLNKLEQHMKELSHTDASVIEELTSAARRFIGLELFSFPVTGIKGLLRALRSDEMVKRYAEAVC